MLEPTQHLHDPELGLMGKGSIHPGRLNHQISCIPVYMCYFCSSCVLLIEAEIIKIMNKKQEKNSSKCDIFGCQTLINPNKLTS